MANTRTVDFLPEIFQTPTNKQFLAATLDQLVQEPQFKQTQGLVGRRVGPGVNPNDSYVTESTQERANYQLEPGVVKLDSDNQRVLDTITYPGITDALRIQGSPTKNSNRLYTSEYYTWDPFVNLDKLVNFSQYFWLEDGPPAVNVFAGTTASANEFTVTRTENGYQFSGVPGTNPVLTLLRGGTYTFNVDQDSSFWIQQFPGTTGFAPANPNISSREVVGVSNNGAKLGTVTFTVPSQDQQAFFYDLQDAGTVDLVTDLKFNQINNIFVDEFLRDYNGIDGISNLDGRTVVFANQDVDPVIGGWLASTQYDPLPRAESSNGLVGSYDSISYDQETVVPDLDRYSVWRIQYRSVNGGKPFMQLVQDRSIANFNKISVLFGIEQSTTQWWKNNLGFWNRVPNLTALSDSLFYQDNNNTLAFGSLRLIDSIQAERLDIRDIIGKKQYISPAGVVFTNNLKVIFRGNVFPETYIDQEYYVAGVGSSIKLLPVSNYVVPEQYNDSDQVDNLSIPDYLIMDLNSDSLSSWSRVNRWFHVDVIADAARYTNTDLVIDNNLRAKRPILEYRGNLKLFNSGTEFKSPVDIIDFSTVDALSNINGISGATLDGYQLVTGTRIVFANDSDPQVKNKIYTVEFIQPDAQSTQQIVNLTAADDPVLPGQSIIVVNGVQEKGRTYYYDGVNWILAQQKTARNQAPLFDVYDLDGVSFGDMAKYPSTSFTGSPLFSYATGIGPNDTVLGFPLKYLALTNVGDIVFDNNFYTDGFTFVQDRVGKFKNVSDGVVREHSTRQEFDVKIGWQTAVAKSETYQQFTFVFNSNEPLILDVPVSNNNTVPALKVYVNDVFQLPDSYSVTVSSTNTTIVLNDGSSIPNGTTVEVLALSDVVSQVGFYQVPINLENNALNENANFYTLGTARAHYQTIAENLKDITGTINGANNIRDLGNVVPYGLKILQQSSPLTLTGYFLRSSKFNIFSSLEYNSREYEKLKTQILATAVANDYTNFSVPAILDAVLEEINVGRSEISPFYWSDMLPRGSVFTEINTTFTAISVLTFDTVQVYNFESANYQGLLVYVNQQQLLRGVDYVVATDGPRLTITKPLKIGDVITIREYAKTVGNFIPSTPSKMGLYPTYRPEIFVDTTYVNPVTVIQGHDGSITVGFNDFRDELLLEFEKRIYNNIKLDNNPIPLGAADVIPGQFRTTGYSLNEVNEILGKDFLRWVGGNKLDYKTQDYQPLNEFTYNYSATSSRLTNQLLSVGAWRGVYNLYYDTFYPTTRPWEMLGFSEQPSWWESYYGPAPYTNGNLVLWDDLEEGLVRDPAGEYVIEKYKRPGLTQVLPAGSEGQLLSPMKSIVSNYSTTDFRKSWTVGDGGPTENAWKTSSAYPFAVMRLLALTRPAQFFSLFADRDLYRYDEVADQFLYNKRYRLDANGVEVYGNGKSKSSFINWIVDYNQQTGVNSTDILTSDLKLLDVHLCYRMAGFSAKNLLQIYTEKSSPDSQNSGLLLPDESYNLLLYKNVPFDTLTYSGVIVQKTSQGFAVWGYSSLTPYFDILKSQQVGPPATISAGGASVQVSTSHSTQVVSVPYGFVFATANAVADFLISYGALLQSKGMIFNDVENGYILDWQQMVSEFLYWTSQSWATGSLINLNPTARKLVIERPLSIVDDISMQTQENIVLDQDLKQLTTKDLIIDRQDNRFSIETTNNQTISFINLKFVNYEHMVVLDNRSIFADLIYDPVTASRQNRVKLVGAISTNWNGQLNAPGFVLNQDNINNWEPLRKYAKGDIVFYKNEYYSAIKTIEPSDTFNFSSWARSNFTKIQQGLLPNLANKSDQLENTYSITTANLEKDQDLLSYGLIGFRPRQYMTSLNLDDVSQVNLYRQFLGSKGTIQSAELFKFADIGRGLTEFNLYENWAVQRALYGANANRSYYEIQLNESLLKSNPSLVQIVLPGQDSIADQPVLISDIWKESYKLSSPNILTTTTTLPTDISLPSAGYVNLDDVDVTLFDLDDTQALNQVIDNIGIGSRIWVAKTNNYDWGVFGCYAIPGFIQQVGNNLDGTSTVEFTEVHQLEPGSIFLIKFFNTEVNGVYRVLSSPSPTTVTIAYDFVGLSQLTLTGEGIGLTLKTLRVGQASDAAFLPESSSLVPGSRIWVDDGGKDQWQVIEKQNVFTKQQVITPTELVANSNFGKSAAQSTQTLFSVIGQPEYSESGAVTFSIRNDFGEYQITDVQEPNAPGARSFGYSVSIGNQNWIAVGAPDSDWTPKNQSTVDRLGSVTIVNRPEISGTFAQTQVLTPPADAITDSCQFGQSVAISADQHWLYIGAPGINKVYAYGLVEIEPQSIQYTADGLTDRFSYKPFIVVNDTSATIAAAQITILINDQVETGFTVNIDTGLVELGSRPPRGARIVIFRKTTVPLDATSTVSFNLIDLLFTITTIDSFTVFVNSAIQRPRIDYTVSGGILTFVETDDNGIPGPGDDIEVRSGSHYQFIGEIIPTDNLNHNAKFGETITCTTDGRQLLVGAPSANIGSVVSAGALYVYDRSVQRFIVSDADQTSYSVSNSELFAPTWVSLNNVFLTNVDGNVSGDFSIAGNTVTFATAPSVGDEIVIDVNTFTLLQKIVADTPKEHGVFGTALDICSSDCSIYVGAPGDTAAVSQDGLVQRNANQSRIYGTIESGAANPVVNSGDSIRINNIVVVVPPKADLSQPTVKDLTTAINSTNIPNVIASVSSDLVFVGDTVTTEFHIGDVYSSADTYIPVVLVNGDLQAINTDYVYDAGSETVVFNSAPLTGSAITVVTGKLRLTSKNTKRGLTVLPGVNDNALWQSLLFNTYPFVQTIVSPAPEINSQFGSSLVVDPSASTLIVGSPRGSLYQKTKFDAGATGFDAGSTTIFAAVKNSGVVYTFDLLRASNSSVSNPDRFVFGQQIFDADGKPGNQFGTAIDYTNQILLITSPGEANTSIVATVNKSGKANLFINEQLLPAWVPIREKTPTVDVSLINSVFAYDAISGAKTEFFDFIDPLQGKILGAAKQNIDFVGAIDPAAYNVGQINNYGKRWVNAFVGKIWWDTNNVRFIDPNQDDIVYASRRWSQVFPGSTVDIYQWVVSDVPPVDYVGTGTPRSISSYTVNTEVNVLGIVVTKYYFWVSDLTTIDTNAGKTLSTNSISRYIESPRNSGIPYVAFVNASTTALYNSANLISAQDTVLSIEFDRQKSDDTVHIEYELIPEDRADGFLSDTLYRKFQDSMCGVDTAGNLVPDPFLRPANKYGVQYRPRQSMFVDRFSALENYLTRVNRILSQYPISENSNLSLLNSEEPIPLFATGEWNTRLTSIEELSYQNQLIVPVGYRYLVESDSTQNGLWTIYETTAKKTFESLQLMRVQNFKTDRYWQYADWYRPGYKSDTQPTAEVNNAGDLATLTVPVGTSVRVRANSIGKSEIYLLEDTGWTRVVLQDGTIEFKEELWNYQTGRFGFDVEVFDSQFFDEEPVIETRKIIQAINQTLLVDELAIERNRTLILMFNLILSEQVAPEWITKTSLVDVDHRIRQLLPFQTYNRDNQEYVIDYIKEVKPYHVQVREFNLIYEGFDIYKGTLTDFDVPAYWNTDLAIAQFTSPVLIPYTKPVATGAGQPSAISDAGADSNIWKTQPWSFWYQNYSLEVETVVVASGGTGYIEPPTVTIQGDAIVPAQLSAVVNSNGVVVAINVVNPGSGYMLTPTVAITGTGTGAVAYPIMNNNLVRSIKTTIKYDRYQYNANIIEWQPDVEYDNGTLVKLDNRVWEANSGDSSPVVSSVFDIDQWTLVPAGNLDAANRTQGYYSPGPNMPGLDLPLLIDGIDYPGVQVRGPLFSQDTGFDVGNYDVNPFDNFNIGPEGRPTYDIGILDAIYESNFLDLFLGTTSTDINIDGGEFVDTYSGHAPEELIPGRTFDTLDFRVFTTPGADWTVDLVPEHGFSAQTISWRYSTATPSQSIADLIPALAQVRVVNSSQGLSLIPDVEYLIDWSTLTVSINNQGSARTQPGDTVTIVVYGLGGGNQLFKQSYQGNDIGRSLFIPMTYSLVTQTAVFVNGELITDYGIIQENFGTLMIFDQTLDVTDFVTILLLGDTEPNIPSVELFDTVENYDIEPSSITDNNYVWSTPSVEYFVASSSADTTYQLSNSSLGTNSVTAIVEKNGLRATPPAGIEHFADDSLGYLLPTRFGIDPSQIQDSDVEVWAAGRYQVQGVDYIVEPYVLNDTREIIFLGPEKQPDSGEQILIFVTTGADYTIDPDTATLVWRLGQGNDIVLGDVIAVTTWNNTDEQNILTKVFVGPVTVGAVVVDGYDTTNFDVGNRNNETGSYDFSAGIVTRLNNFDLTRTVTDYSRLWVTLNRRQLTYNVDFIVRDQELILASGTINAIDQLVVTMFANKVAPDALAFRIFQDMREVQALYRITANTTTVLTQPLLTTDSIVHVRSVKNLHKPDLNNNIWGIITINGERILYRELDESSNTISSLLRGSAGTAIADHLLGSTVYNISRPNLAPIEYQKQLVKKTYIADGDTTEFITDINLSSHSIGFAQQAVEVYVAGSLQQGTYFILDIDPVAVMFDDPPPEGVEIVVLVRQSEWWYNTETEELRNQPLQETDTIAARFFRNKY